MKNKLTITLPVYNGEMTVGRTIESIINQDIKDFSLVIIDNNSSDKTLEICSNYASKYNWIKLISKKDTVTMPNNWNRCFDETDDGYFTMIHADDFYETNFVSSILNCINDLNPDFIFFNTKIIDTKGELLEKLNHHSFNEITKRAVLKRFPGLQRQVWKRKKITNKFESNFFPIFDYIWFFKNLHNIDNLTYLDKYLVKITSDENQTTNKVSWEKGILKSIIYLFLNKVFEKDLKLVAIRHLISSLKGHFSKRLKKAIYG